MHDVEDCIIDPNSSLLSVFMSFTTWLCNLSQKRDNGFPAPLTLGLSMWLALANRMRWKWACVLGDLTYFLLPCCSSTITMRRTCLASPLVIRSMRIMWNRYSSIAIWCYPISANLHTGSKKPSHPAISSPDQPNPSQPQTWQWAQLRPSELPSPTASSCMPRRLFSCLLHSIIITKVKWKKS